MANKPNNPALWSRAKSLAKQKFDVYPSAYANGWAAKWYKSKGGTWSKAEYGMEIMDDGGEPDNPGFRALPEYVQQKIMANMAFGGYTQPPMYMQMGGEPDGSMALGQIEAAINKLQTLKKFIQPDSDLEPWVSSKLTLMDHYTDAVSDYMMYNPEAQMMQQQSGLPMEQMAEGGIPQRYKNMGFTKVGAKKNSTRPGKKWMVLAKKGDDYKVVHGGYDGMKDYTQHGSEKRRDRFWDRMGGKNSAKAKDPFSPLYWHKRFGTWANGGEIFDLPMAQEGWVQRAANANLRAWEKCRMSQGKDCAAVFGTSPSGKAYKDVYSSLSDIDAYDRDERKMFKQTLPQGVSLEDWTAFNREATRLNAVFNNPDYDKYFDEQGALKPDYENIATNFEPYSLFYKPAFVGKKKVTPTDIMNFHMNQPYGISGYKDLVNKGYRAGQKKKGGSTFSGNAWYQTGGPVMGEEMEVSPEQLEMLRQQGYKFEIL